MIDIAERAKKGLPLEGIRIIDSHTHMGFFYNFNVPNGTPEGMLSSMDSLGVDMAVVTAHCAIGPDYVFGNSLVISAVQKYPKRFLGYVTLNPNYTDEMEGELERCLAVPGMRGIKLHPSAHGLPIDHKHNHRVYEYAEERSLPVLLHIWGREHVQTIDKLAGRYRKVKYLMGHCGADVRAMETAIDVVAKHDNVFGDLALSTAREGNIEWLVREMGSKALLYASDMPFYDPSPTLGRVALADISQEQKEDIFGKNMARILDQPLRGQ